MHLKEVLNLDFTEAFKAAPTISSREDQLLGVTDGRHSHPSIDC